MFARTHILGRFAAAFWLLFVVVLPARAQQGAAPPERLRLAGHARISAIYDFEVVPPYVYALERGAIHVLDASEPGAIRELGRFELRPPRTRMTLRGRHLYVRGFGAPLGVLDVSDAAFPRLVAEHAHLAPAPGKGFQLAGDMALLVRRSDATDAAAAANAQAESGAANRLFLDVLDLAHDPVQPRVLGSVDLGVRAAGEFGAVSYADGRAYVIVSRPLGADARSQLIVVDVRDPARATIERRLQFPTGRQYRNLEVRGDLLYVLQQGEQQAGENGLSIWRLAAHGELEPLGEATSAMFRFPIDLMMNGDIVYFTVKGVPTFVTVDVADPRRPRVVHAHVENENWAGGLGMARHGDRLYVTGDQAAAGIFDIAVRDAPRHIGSWFEGGAARQVMRTGDLAIVASLTDLLFYDVSVATSPVRVGRHRGVPLYWTGGAYQANVVTAASGARVVVAYESIPAELLDISDAARPAVLGRFEPAGLVHAIAAGPTHAFLAYRSGAGRKQPQVWEPATLAASGGIEVIDLNAAGGPRSVATVEVDGVVTDVAAAGGRLVAAHHDGAITIVDATDPERPTVLARLPGSGAAALPFGLRTAYVTLSSDGRWAYVSHAVVAAGADPFADGAGVLTILDLADASRPRPAARLEYERSGGTSVPVSAAGDLIAVLQGELGGVMVVSVRDPERPVVVAREPLPESTYAEGLAMDGAHLYVGAWEDGVLVYALPRE